MEPDPVFATSGADILVAEVVGLLLEGLGLDDTLGGEDSLRLVSDVAALHVRSEAPTLLIQSTLSQQFEHALVRVQAREEFSNLARTHGLTPDPPYIEAAQRILEQDADLKFIGGLKGVPKEAAELALHDFELAHRKVKQACARVQEAWCAVEDQIEPSALTALDLPGEARALRDGGWLFGWIRTKSDGARDRVKPHLALHLRGRSAEEMANILDQVIEYKAQIERFRAHVADAHGWVVWAVNTDNGKLNKLRAASLRWLLTKAEAGNFGAVERDLLTNGPWRRVLSQDAARRWAKAVATTPTSPDLSSLGRVIELALGRVEAWVAHPPHLAPGEFAEFVRVMTAGLPELAVALVVTQEAQDKPATSARVLATVALSQGPFGPADTNRVRFRALLEQSRKEVMAARLILEPLRPQHPHLVKLVGELREAEGLMLSDLRSQAPARGPLRVAIAGRTKAGKTTLRKVLTRDLSETGIGRGAHRTTRTADDFAWERITFVDTPGVSAKDDEFDAGLAAQTCRDADAVVWVFAESLHDEEARILQSLLAVKPVLVVYNAKRRVDNVRRLALFARSPALAFDGEASHAERTQQMAEAAGVREPLFIAAHVSAARRALLADGESHAAWGASRIPLLESELRRVLQSQAQGLRSLRLADQVRTPIAVAAGRAAETVDILYGRCQTFQHRLANEERDLRDAVARAISLAKRKNQKDFAAASVDLPGWLEKVDGRGDSLDTEWSTFLSRLQVDALLGGITDSIAADAQASGLLLDREDRLEERLQRMRFQAVARRGLSPLARGWRVLKRFFGLVARVAPRLRGEAALGPIGWAAVAADLVATTGLAVTDEVRLSRIDRHSWERNADQAARRALERVRRRVSLELDLVSAALLDSVNDHFSQARADITVIADSLAAVDGFGSRAERVITEIDKFTVERLLQLGNMPPGGVISVDRVPNLHLRVKVVGDPKKASRCLQAVFDGCSSEVVTVTRGHRKNRRMRELSA
jgi:50S ribosome-binding GTPase